MKKKSKQKIRTLGDLERETIKRDKKLEKKLEKKRSAYYSEQRAKGKQSKTGSLKEIQKRGTNICQDCGKEKSIKDFYIYFDTLGTLIKIFPNCKVCDRRCHRGNSFVLAREQKKLCLEYYGKKALKKLKCTSCEKKNIDELILFDSKYKNEKAISTARLYKKLCHFNYPDIKFKIMCVGCAYVLIASYKK